MTKGKGRLGRNLQRQLPSPWSNKVGTEVCSDWQRLSQGLTMAGYFLPPSSSIWKHHPTSLFPAWSEHPDAFTSLPVLGTKLEMTGTALQAQSGQRAVKVDRPNARTLQGYPMKLLCCYCRFRRDRRRDIFVQHTFSGGTHCPRRQ